MFNPEKVLIPCPQNISDTRGDVKIGESLTAFFTLKLKGEGEVFEEAIKLFWTKFSSACAIRRQSDQPTYEIRIEINAENESIKGRTEAYTLNIEDKKACLIATDEAGAYYGVLTLTSMIHVEGNDVYLPMVDIVDYPRFKFRGQMLECRYGSDFMTKEDYKKAIDYFASLKQNNLSIAVYGCWSQQYDSSRSESMYIPIKKYPFLKTPRNIKCYSVKNQKWVVQENRYPLMYEEDFFGELVEYGKRKNVTVFPMFNSLGHNSLIPRLIPETAAKNEEGIPVEDSTVFCTENEKTYEVMVYIYDEIIERYLKPYGITSINIGLDEVRQICKCEKCRNIEHTELLLRYVIRLCKYLKSKGIKEILICYDMFFQNKNILNEDLKQRFIREDIFDVVVIVWWNYAGSCTEFHGRKDEVNSIFRSIAMPMTGYFHWSIPSEINRNIYNHAIMADELNFEGINCYGAYEECFDKNFSYSADLSWNPSMVNDPAGFQERYARTLFPDYVPETVKVLDDMREMMFMVSDYDGNLMKNLEYYSRYSYTAKIKAYPDHAFETILEDKNANMDYLKNVLEKSTAAMQFFSDGTSHITKVWELIAMHYSTYADIFYQLTSLYLKRESGEKIGVILEKEVKRLLERLNKLMAVAEEVRLEANSFVYLRNMSIMRQFLVDLLAYVEKEIGLGREPQFDVTDFSQIKSEMFRFLR